MGMMKRKRRGRAVVVLGEKAKTLAKLVYKQEVNGIKNNPFRSEYDRRLHLEASRKAYLNSLSITQLASSDSSETKSKSETDEQGSEEEEQKKADIGRSFKEYLEYAVGYAYSCIPNINMREEYLSRVSAHAWELKAQIRGFQSSDFTAEKAEEIFNNIQTFKRTTYEAIFDKADKPYRVMSRVTRPSLNNFSQTLSMVRRKFLMERGVTYNRQYGVRLPLDDNGKVIDSMIDTLAKENKVLKNGTKVLKGVGRAVIVITAAMMVYDACKAKGGVADKVEHLAKDASNLAIGYYIGGAAETATVWGAEVVLGTTLLGASALLSFGVGVLAIGIGFAVAYYASPYVSKGVDWIFQHLHNLFEKHPGVQKHEDSHPHAVNKSSVYDLKPYVAPPPDGLTLANQLAYEGGN